MATVLLVRPHQMTPAAIRDLEAKLRALPGRGRFLKEGEAEMMIDGMLAFETARPSLVEYVVEMQGLAARCCRAVALEIVVEDEP